MQTFRTFALTGMILTIVFAIIAAIRIYRLKRSIHLHGCVSFVRNHYRMFLVLLFMAFLATRLFRIDQIPAGIHIDELSSVVDAKSIMDHGSDRFGVRYPVYLQNFGGGQNVLFCYVQVLLFHFLPFTIKAFRIQAVLWGALCFLATFGICYELTEDKAWALAGPFLVTTLPVYIMSERWGLESYLLLPFCTFTMYYVIRAVKYGKMRDWFLAGLIMGVSLYTYAISYIVWPIFLILAGAYLLYIKRINIKQIIIAVVPLIILATPLILFQLVNLGLIPEFSTVISDYRRLPERRETEIGVSNILWNLVHYYPKMFFEQDSMAYNSFREFGPIYWFLVPFIAVGLVVCIIDLIVSLRKKEFLASAPVVFFWLSATICMLVIKAPNINKVNELFLPFVVFIVIATFRLFNKDMLFEGWLALFNCISFVVFIYFYFFIQSTDYGPNELFTSSSPARAIRICSQNYLKDDDTHIYALLEDETIEPYMQVYFFAGEAGEVYSDDVPTYGRVSAYFPEEFDINENAVYIIGDNWPHITSYLVSVGFCQDQSLPGYSILYR